MSSESPVEDHPINQGVPTSDLDRGDGVTTVPRSFPMPPAHGFAGSLVVNDVDRDASEIPDRPRYKTLPDGSLYQHARARWYALADEADGQSVVLEDAYNPSWSDELQEVAVVMTSSRWRAGTHRNGSYSAWYKYDLSLRQVEDGEVTDRAPAEALNVKLQPQVDGLQDSDGNDLEIPYGEGTLVNIQTTWVESPDDAKARALELVEETLGYDFEAGTIAPNSRKLWKAEAHHRFAAEREGDVVHTVRQSTDLLARHAADVDENAKYDDGNWLEAKVTTRDWHKLGFPMLGGAPILLKVYHSSNPDKSPYPYDQPKIEAALAGNPGRDKLSWDDFDAVLGTLREIVSVHLLWSGVGREDLVADDFSDGPNAEPHVFAHPEGRRDWLRDHYENLVPDIYREATKTNTQLVYDILDVVRRQGVVSYQDLMDETGGAYRTIREHVSRLCRTGASNLDAPGILEKVHSTEVLVAFSSYELEERANDVLDDVHPDDTPEERRDRADDRREKRLERAREQEESSEPDEEADSASGTADGPASGDDEDSSVRSPVLWSTVADLSLEPDQLAQALDRGYVQEAHVKIRTDPYDWIGE